MADEVWNIEVQKTIYFLFCFEKYNKILQHFKPHRCIFLVLIEYNILMQKKRQQSIKHHRATVSIALIQTKKTVNFNMSNLTVVLLLRSYLILNIKLKHNHDISNK